MSGVDVTLARDWCVAVPVSRHLAMPPAGAGAPDFHADLPCNVAWPPGGLVGAHKLTNNVFHLGSTIALAGHDCGVMIPHWCVKRPWPPNPALAIIIPFSERKVRFSSSLVSMNGAGGALASVSEGMPMTLCSDPFALPIMFPEHMGCTVFMGFSPADFEAGFADIAIDVVAELVFRDAGDPPGSLSDQLGDKLGGLPSTKSLIVGLAKGLKDYAIKGKGKFEVGMGSPYRSEQFEVEFEKHEEHWWPKKASGTYESRTGHRAKSWKLEGDANKQFKVERSKTKDGLGGFDGGGSTTEKTELDLRTGKTTKSKEAVDRGEGTHSKKEGDGSWDDWLI